MDLTTQAIAEFIAIWAREFNEILTEDEARAEAERLLELHWLLAHPLPSELPDPAPSDSQTATEG